MTLSVIITAGVTAYDCSDYVVLHSVEIDEQLFNPESFKPNTNKAVLRLHRTCPYIDEIFAADGDISIAITADAIPVFSGYLTDNYSLKITARGGSDVELTAEDPGIRLLKKPWASTGGLYTSLSGKKVCDSADTGNSFVHILAALSGVTVSATVPTISDLVYFSVEDKKKFQYWEILEGVLFDFRHTFYFDASGELCLFAFGGLTGTPSTVVRSDATILQKSLGDAGIEIKKRFIQYKEVNVQYKEGELVTSAVVFRDTTGQGLTDCDIEIAAGGYYPTSCDASTYSYIDYFLEDGRDILAVTSATADFVVDTGITYEFTHIGKSAQIRFYNQTALPKHIRKLKVTGSNVYVVKADSTMTSNEGGGKKLEVEANYLTENADAQSLANLLRYVYANSSALYTFRSYQGVLYPATDLYPSETLYPLGDTLELGGLIRLYDPLWTGLDVNCAIYRKKYTVGKAGATFEALGIGIINMGDASVYKPVAKPIIKPIVGQYPTQKALTTLSDTVDFDGQYGVYGGQRYIGTKPTTWTLDDAGQTIADAAQAAAQAYADGLADTIQTQIDRAIVYFTQAGDPSSAWTADEKKEHTGDYWRTATGAVWYQWSGAAWVEISDPVAQQAADDAQTTADDKITVWADLATAQANALANDLFLTSGLLYRCLSDAAATYERITPKRWPDGTTLPTAETHEPLLTNDTFYKTDTYQWYYYTTSWVTDGEPQLIDDDVITLIPTYTPHNLGRYDHAHPATHNPGDWWTVFDTDDDPIQRGIWYDNAGTPTRISAVSGEAGYTTDATLLAKLSSCMADVAWCEKNSYGVAADYGIAMFFESFGAVTAFIQNLFAQNITLGESGYLKSHDYAEDDDDLPTAGFKLDVANQLIKSYGSMFTNAYIKNVQLVNAVLSGILSTSELETKKTITVTWTAPGEDYYFAGALIEAFGLSVGQSIAASGTFNGKTVVRLECTAEGGRSGPTVYVYFSDATHISGLHFTLVKVSYAGSITVNQSALVKSLAPLHSVKAITTDKAFNCYNITPASLGSRSSGTINAGARSSEFTVYKPITVYFASGDINSFTLELVGASGYYTFLVGNTANPGGVALNPGKYVFHNVSESDSQSVTLLCVGAYGTTDGSSIWS